MREVEETLAHKGQNEVFVHEIGATVADDTTTGYKSLCQEWHRN